MESSRKPRSDDLLMLLAVARAGRYARAAEQLGVDHTTVSRRIDALEEALGGRLLTQASGGWELTALGSRAVDAAGRIEAAVSALTRPEEEADPIEGVVRMSATDGFSAYIAAPAIAALRREHPRLSVEILTVTRQALQHRSGLDLEIVVGPPQTRRAHTVELGSYTLGMYASRAYLERTGVPQTREDVFAHPLVYFVESILQVDDLDLPRRLAPQMRDALTSTNVFVHVEATRVGAGIGLLPCFMADRHDDLVRLLPAEFSASLPYWMVIHPDSLRHPAVAAVADALREQVRRAADALAGRAAR
ncbi:LysR family transcriptional regulator [Leifsonia shinshuensis]|nr:LysR family transcriptional regulator [Leifsonia shinshuensis]